MTTTADPQPQTASAWAPLRHRIFAIVLVTSIAAQIATFMNGLASAWEMTALTDSAVLIASLQTAVALGAMLLALIAGALTDIVSRKNLILFSLGGSVLVTGVFAVLSWTDSHTPTSLLALTVGLGVLTALAAPAWIAVIPSLVKPSELASAMSLSSAGVSVAMALGPAIAGVVIAAAGTTAVFALNALVFLAGIVAMSTWRPVTRTGLPSEHLLSAIRLGLQYLWFDRPLKVVIAKIVPFALVATALPALLPIVAIDNLGAGPALFGLLSGASGIGAVLGLFVLPRVRRLAGSDTIIAVGMVVEAVTFAVLAWTTSTAVAFGFLVLAGVATLAIISTVMTALQAVLPDWVRGRGIAVYLFVLQGSFALGAFLWGSVAQSAGLDTALVAASATLVVGALITIPLRIGSHEDRDTSSWDAGLEAAPVTSVYDTDGPIEMSATWTVADDRRGDFISAMIPLRKAMRRNGALRFTLAEDTAQPGTFVESFTVATWAEYQRLPERSMSSDAALLADVAAAAGGELPELVVRKQVQLKRRQADEGLTST